MSSETLLETRNLCKAYGGVRALDDASISIAAGEIVGLIGPNGSGKTSFINAVTGAARADRGRITFDGHAITRAPSHRRVHRGINRTYQIPAPFGRLTVRENVLVAATYGRRDGDPDAAIERAGLAGFEDWDAAALNSTQQKRLDLARALATAPRLLLVDEIAAGLNPTEAQQLSDLLKGLAAEGVTLLVVEHLMAFVRTLTTRVVVMDRGAVIFEGRLDDAARDARVIDVFLGKADENAGER